MCWERGSKVTHYSFVPRAEGSRCAGPVVSAILKLVVGARWEKGEGVATTEWSTVRP